MDIVFFASGKFGLKSLEALLQARCAVRLVVTQPDRPKGRHLDYQPTDVKKRALELNLSVYQPQDPNSQEAIEILRENRADLFIVIAYSHILKDTLLKLPKTYPLNVHASLLPKYRGASPINWAIINGEKETGVSVIRMAPQMDAGDILLQEKIPIEEDDTALTLGQKLEFLAADALIEALQLIETGKTRFIKQDDSKASFAVKLEKKHGEINWNKGALEIARQVKGLLPWPATFTRYKAKLLKVWNVKIREENSHKPAEILEVTPDRLVVGTAKGSLEILELQLEGGRRLSAGAFLSGHKLAAGEKLG
jgi:methionyl-tRNA formyltransferase